MNVTENHNVPKEQMLVCAKQLLTRLKNEHSGRISQVVQIWTDYESKFSFRISNFKIEGTLTVHHNKIVIEGRLPFGARLFQGMVEDIIHKNMKELIAQCPTKNV